MTDEKSENGALELLMKRRPSFRKIYEEAPDGAKAYYRGTCLTTVKAMGDGHISSPDEEADWEKLLHSLTDEDWEYLKSHAPTAVVACGLHITQSRIRGENRKRLEQISLNKR